MEVVKSIASLCDEDPYKLWRSIAAKATLIQPVEMVSRTEVKTQTSAQPVTGSCWRCTACNRTFNDIKHLVNHITFFVRQKERAHLDLYKKIKESADKSGKTFTQVCEETLRC